MESASPGTFQNSSGVDAESPQSFHTGHALPCGSGVEQQWFHRIGGGNIDNLRLKSKEATLNSPGISLLQSSTAKEAAKQIQAAFPRAGKLLEESRQIGSITMDQIQAAGF